MPENGCLDLTNQRINATAIRTKPFQISFNRIKCLKLGFNYLEDDGTKLIAELMSSCHNITSVDLGFNRIGNDGACALGSKLCGHKSLKSLYLSGNNITDIGCASIASIVRHSPVLQNLYMSGNLIHKFGARELASTLTCSRSLEKLDISSCGIGVEGFIYISEAIAKCTSVRELNIANNDGGDIGIQTLARAMTQYRDLEMLDVSFNGISNVGSDALCEALSGYSALRVLNISNNRLGDAAVDGLVFVLGESKLEELQIGFCRLTSRGTQAIIRALTERPKESCCLKSIALSGNIMNTEGARAFAGLLAIHGGCSLREVHIDQMNFGQTGKRDIAVSIATNPDCALDVVTGLQLGPLMVELGSPSQLLTFTNGQVLQYIKNMWAEHRLHGTSTGKVLCAVDDAMEEELASACTNADSTTPTLLESRCATRASNTSLGHGSSSTELLAHLAADVHRSHIKRSLSQMSPSLPSEHSEAEDEVITYPEAEDNDLTDSCGSDISHPGAPTSVGIANKGTATTEQIDIVSKQLEHMFEPMLQEIAAMPFDPSNLWMLHQFYYSPINPEESPEDRSLYIPPTNDCIVDVAKKESLTRLMTFKEHPSCDSRPAKKRGNRLTMTRIAEYPRIQYRLECLKLDSNQSSMLTLLRQLRCVEEYIDTYKSKYPLFSLISVESILLDENGLQKLT